MIDILLYIYIVRLIMSKCIVCKIKYSCFGNEDDDVARYCGNCKLTNMVDIKHPKCIKCNKKRSNYSLVINEKPLYCKDCRTSDMINVVSRKCIKCNKKNCTFGLSTDSKAQFCGDCKTNEMIDIKHRKCIKCNITRPNFGVQGGKAEYCYDCKTEDMIDINNIKCIVCNTKRANFGLANNKMPLYCYDCKNLKNINTVDVTHPKCKSEWCSTRCLKKYDNYCFYCYTHLFPDKPVSKNCKTKEISVAQFVKNNFTEVNIITDKKIYDGCSRRRPDIFIDLGNQIIIVEIDENQHTDYDCSCENKRLMELSLDVNHRPIVFIRFNPDSYKKDNKTVSSCWCITKTGVCTVKKIREWNERLCVLKDTIDYWIQNQTNKITEVIQLFYDE